MTVSVYIFGNFGSGYTQYPYDYSHGIFDMFQQNIQDITQIAIHRDNDLMYYGYLRKLDTEKYIGICAVVNDKIVADINRLFTMFEETIELMVSNGYLIYFGNNGEITSHVNLLYENNEEIAVIATHIQSVFDGVEPVFQDLPPVNYSVSKDSIQSFSWQDENNRIVTSSYTNGWTFIHKSKEYDTFQINNIKGVLIRRESELKVLEHECQKLRNKISFYRKLFIYTLILIVLIAVLLALGVF